MNRIQNIRKSNDYDITDKIVVTIDHNEHTDKAVAAFADYIAKQVLAVGVTVAAVAEGEPNVSVLDMDDYKLNVKVEKA